MTPIFDYKCPVCGIIEEKFIKLEDMEKPVYCDCDWGNVPTMIKQVSKPYFPHSQRRKGEVDK